MIIQKATKKDLKELIKMGIEFEKECIKHLLSKNNPTKSLNKDAETKIKESTITDFNSKNNEFIIAKNNKIIIGVVRISKVKLKGIYNTREIGKLNFLYVKKPFRKKGVASKLYNEAIKIFKQMGIEYISLLVDAKNDTALSFYKKQGFEEEDMGLIKRI